VAVLKSGLCAERKDEIADAFARLYPERAGIVADAMDKRRR
jgi:hypothetical protein